MRRALVAAAIAALPQLAQACPSCAAQAPKFPAVLALVGGFLGVPFVVAGVAFLVIRRLSR